MLDYKSSIGLLSSETRVIPLLWCLCNFFDKALSSQFWRKLMETDFFWCIIEFNVIWLCCVSFKKTYCQRTYTSCIYFDTIIRFNEIYHLLITLLNQNFISQFHCCCLINSKIQSSFLFFIMKVCDLFLLCFDSGKSFALLMHL